MFRIFLELLRYESIKEEFIKQGGLPQIEKFATCFEKDSFQLRDAALKVMHILYDCHLDPSNDVINTISVRKHSNIFFKYIQIYQFALFLNR